MTAGERTQRVRNANQSANRGEDRQNNEWNGHRQGRFVRRVRIVRGSALGPVRIVFRLMMWSVIMTGSEAFLAPERHHHQACHVDGSQQSSNGADEPKCFV